jgi:predicted metalloenzyme YecM
VIYCGLIISTRNVGLWKRSVQMTISSYHAETERYLGPSACVESMWKCGSKAPFILNW